MAPPLPEMPEELMEEILLRFPPDDPATLLRAALICKLWRRLICSAAFRLRFLEFHRSAARLLGVLYTKDSRRPYPAESILRPHNLLPPGAPSTPIELARHRRPPRVLVCRSGHGRDDLLVWDPVTDEQRDLPAPPFYLADYSSGKWNAAVTCAAAAGGGNCDHLNCRRGPFLVVVMVMNLIFHTMYLSVYSSEAAAWSKKVTVCKRPTLNSFFKPSPGVLVRSAFYFLVHFNGEIVEYDMATQKVSTVRLPYRFRRLKRSIVLMTDDHGGLGFVANVKDKLELWSRVAAGADGDAGAPFVLTRVIDLRKVLPSGALIKNSAQVKGFADGGARARRILFIRMSDDGLYSIEINYSSHVRKLDNCCGDKDVVPSLHKLSGLCNLI